MSSAIFLWCPLQGALVGLTYGDPEQRGVGAEASAPDGQPGAPQQGAHPGGDAVDLQDVLDAGVHAGAGSRGRSRGWGGECLQGLKAHFISFILIILLYYIDYIEGVGR